MDNNEFQQMEEKIENKVAEEIEKKVEEVKLMEPELTVNKNIKTEKKGRKYFFTALLGALLGVIIGGVGVYYFLGFNNNPQTDSIIADHQININTNGDVYYAAAVAQKSRDSVVGIITKGSRDSAFFGSQTYEGMGSGVIVDSNGY